MERVNRMGGTRDLGNRENDGWNKVPENRGEGVMYLTNALYNSKGLNSCYVL